MRGILRILLILLSIIGIILAVVLALLLLVLFVPFRYRAHGSKEEEIYAKGYISWLLHFMHISFVYEKEELRGVLRVLGIPVKRFNSQAEAVKKTEEAQKSDLEELEKEETEPAEVVAMEQSSTIADEKEEEKKKENKTPTEDKKQKSNKKNQKTEKTTVEDKKVQITEKIELIKQFWQENKGAVQFLLKRVGALLKELLPKKLKGTIWFGTGDPCSTGELTGALAVF